MLLEQFCWQWPDRLEVTGQWRGVASTRLRDPVLLISGGSVRMLNGRVPRALSERAAASERWRASFRYSGDPAQITGAELRAAPGLSVTLPPPSATRRRFERLLLDVRVDGEAALAAIRAEPESAGEDVRERAAHADAIRRLQQELQTARTSSMQLSRELERERTAHSRAVADIERMGHQLHAMKESRDQLQARMTLESERLGQAGAELERSRSREAADVERLSGAVRRVRAELERLTLDHRAELRRLAEDLAAALDRIETLAADTGAHADLARHVAHDAPPSMLRRLDAIMQQTRELATVAHALRRRVVRVAAPGAAESRQREP